MTGCNQELSDSNTNEYRILYIEDNPANLRLVTQILGRIPGIEFCSAIEPVSGLELAKTRNPDLILVDINLPDMDGYEVLQQLRKQAVTRNTTVIAISANAMPRDIAKAKQAGFDHYITKPINVEMLLETVNGYLQKK